MPRGRQSAEVNPSLGFRFDRADGVSKDDPQKLSMQPAEAKQYRSPDFTCSLTFTAHSPQYPGGPVASVVMTRAQIAPGQWALS